MEKLVIWIIVGIAWAVRASWDKSQKRQTELRRGEQPSARPAATQSQPLSEADRRYREIQDEIRQRKAARMQRGQPEPGQMPSPGWADPPPQPTLMAPPTVAPLGLPRRSRRATKSRARTPEPAMAMPRAMAMPPPPPPPPNVDAGMLTAYALPESTGAASSTDTTGWRAKLTSPGMAQQAFILKEIFDRPLCLRPVLGGGHEDWN